MHKSLICIGIVLLATACSGASSHEIVGPNGRTAHRITCHPDISECLEQAGEDCPGGYDVITSTVHSGGTIVDLLPGPVPWYNVLVSCR
jgi:hypothetical protein